MRAEDKQRRQIWTEGHLYVKTDVKPNTRSTLINADLWGFEVLRDFLEQCFKVRGAQSSTGPL